MATAFPELKKRAHKCQRLRQLAQWVGVGDATRKEQSVKGCRIGFFERHIHRKFIRLIEVRAGLHLPFGRRDDEGRGAGFIKHFPGRGQLHLRKSIRKQDGGYHSVKHARRRGTDCLMLEVSI